MITRLNRHIEQRDKGFTLIELLVVIIIIGILAAIAIPAFLNQRTKGYDAAAKSDLKNASTAMETFYTDAFAYPTTATALSAAGFNQSKGVTYTAWVSNSSSPGYVIIANHTQSGQAWIVSSYNGGAPVKTADATAMPASGQARTDLKLPGSAWTPVTFTAPAP